MPAAFLLFPLLGSFIHARCNFFATNVLFPATKWQYLF